MQLGCVLAWMPASTDPRGQRPACRFIQLLEIGSAPDPTKVGRFLKQHASNREEET